MSDLSIPNDALVNGNTVDADEHNANNAAIETYINNRNSGSATWDAMKVSATTANPVDVASSSASGTEVSVNNTAADGDPMLTLKISGTTAGKIYVDDSDSDKLKLSNGTTDILTLATAESTFGSPLAMGSNKITGLAAGTTTGDAVRYEQVVKNTGDETVAGVKTFSSSPVLSTNAATTPTAGSLNRDAAGGISWAHVTQSAGTFSLIADVNVASLSDDGTGLFTLTWATAYTAVNTYAVTLGVRSGLAKVSTMATTTSQITTTDFADNPADRNSVVTVIAIGRQ